MQREQRKIPVPPQYSTFSDRSNSLRIPSKNSDRPGAQNITIRGINELKQGQKKLVESQEKLVEGQEKIVSELSKMSISIDNLARKIGDLVQKINSNGNISKKSSLSQSLSSDYSKNTSGTAIYIRRDKIADNSKQRKEIPLRKAFTFVQNYDNYSKVKKTNIK